MQTEMGARAEQRIVWCRATEQGYIQAPAAQHLALLVPQHKRTCAYLQHVAVPAQGAFKDKKHVISQQLLGLPAATENASKLVCLCSCNPPPPFSCCLFPVPDAAPVLVTALLNSHDIGVLDRHVKGSDRLCQRHKLDLQDSSTSSAQLAASPTGRQAHDLSRKYSVNVLQQRESYYIIHIVLFSSWVRSRTREDISQTVKPALCTAHPHIFCHPL